MYTNVVNSFYIQQYMNSLSDFTLNKLTYKNMLRKSTCCVQ